MIKTMYGVSIHSDLRQAIEACDLSSKFYLLDCNTDNVAAALSTGTVMLPCVAPFVQSKYIVNPKVSTYQTVGADGKENTHIFDFTSTMPVNLFVQITILANNISEIEEMEKLLTERYTQAHKLTVEGFDVQGNAFPFVIETDSKKEIERSGGAVTIAGQQQKMYQSVIHLRCDRCVEVLKNYSPAQVQLDTDLQKQLVKRIVGLDATYDQFSKASQNSTDLPGDAIEYAQKSIGTISSARESLVKALNLPAAYSNPQMVSKLYAMINDNNCDLRAAIEKMDKQEKAAASSRAAAQNRENQIQAVKKALDLTTTISSHSGTLSQLRSQKYSPRPEPPTAPRPVQAQYPEIKPEVPFWSAELLPALFFWPWIIIYYFTGYKKKKEAEAERIRNTPEYRQQCAALDEAARQKQFVLEHQYHENMKVYQEDTIPKYEKALAEWTEKHKKEIAEQEALLDKAKQELAAHYAVTKIVPEQYRTAEALRHIYEVMRSSNYTIPQAIDNYDQKIRQQIEAERLRVQQAAYEEERRRADAEERRAEAEERRRSEAAVQNSYREPSRYEKKRMEKEEIERERRKQEALKKNYFNTSKCQRYGLNGKKSCAGCPIAHMCKF